MIDYRPFRNSDPPELLRLWEACDLGRGAAVGFDADIFETVVFSQPYFDPAGLTVACEAGRPIGFLHAGFGPCAEERRVEPAVGTICVLMVDPAHRRRGIGRALVARAEDYFRARGATVWQAGPAVPHDPFYFGIYGGCQPAGFLESDPAADPFWRASGYHPDRRRLVFQRSLEEKSSPGGLRLMNIRRATRLAAPERETDRTWWWSTRPGRLDTIELALLPKAGDAPPFARVTILGLDFYVPRWQQRAVGLMDLNVPEPHRRKGYGQALLVEVCRRLRDERISLVEAHAESTDDAAIGVLKAAGFQQVDTGTVYRKTPVAA